MSKKPALILGGVAVVAVLTAAISTTLALLAPKETPPIAVWASSGFYTRVQPLYYCDFDLKDCPVKPGASQPTRIEVGPRARVLVSVPEEVAKGWVLDVEWLRETPQGAQTDVESRPIFKKDGMWETTDAAWIEPRPGGWQLRSLTVKIPSRVLDPEKDEVLYRAAWMACADDCPAGGRVGG